jgi:poly-gamma-glutamate capsule biosynthesis protein CapA/YwtB (metallophosphatase superfamily)
MRYQHPGLVTDIVAGHHPHVLQEPELYMNALTLYSLGNFIFDQRRQVDRRNRIYRVVVNMTGLLRASYLPVMADKASWQPTPTAPDPFPPFLDDEPKRVPDIPVKSTGTHRAVGSNE